MTDHEQWIAEIKKRRQLVVDGNDREFYHHTFEDVG